MATVRRLVESAKGIRLGVILDYLLVRPPKLNLDPAAIAWSDCAIQVYNIIIINHVCVNVNSAVSSFLMKNSAIPKNIHYM